MSIMAQLINESLWPELDKWIYRGVDLRKRGLGGWLGDDHDTSQAKELCGCL